MTGAVSILDCTGATVRRPGRPRDAALETRVLQAVIDLIDAGLPVTAGEVVERSGVSRAAIYRRWNTLDALIAAALDVGRVVVHPPEHLSIREALRFGFPRPEQGTTERYPEGRLRQRMLLALADPDLQHQYWERHVSRRREPYLRSSSGRASVEKYVLTSISKRYSTCCRASTTTRSLPAVQISAILIRSNVAVLRWTLSGTESQLLNVHVEMVADRATVVDLAGVAKRRFEDRSLRS